MSYNTDVVESLYLSRVSGNVIPSLQKRVLMDECIYYTARVCEVRR